MPFVQPFTPPGEFAEIQAEMLRDTNFDVGRLIHSYASEGIPTAEIDPTVDKILGHFDYVPLYDDAHLNEIEDFEIDSPEHDFSVSFEDSYNRLRDKEGPKAGAMLGLVTINGQRSIMYVSRAGARAAAVGEVESELFVKAFELGEKYNLPVGAILMSSGMDQLQRSNALEGMNRVSLARKIYGEKCPQPFYVMCAGPVYGGTPACVTFEADIVVAVGEGLASGFTGPRPANATINLLKRPESDKITDYDQSAIANMRSNSGFDAIINPDEIIPYLEKYFHILGREPNANDPEERLRFDRLHRIARKIGRRAISQDDLEKTIRVMPMNPGTIGLRSVLAPLYIDHPKGEVLPPNHFHLPNAQKLPSTDAGLDPERLDYDRHTSPSALDHLDMATILHEVGEDNYLWIRNPEEWGNRLRMSNIAAAIIRLTMKDGSSQPALVIGHQPDYEVFEDDGIKKLRRIFSEPRPENWELTPDLVSMAERLRLPIFTFIDTPGAASDRRAEANGQAVEMSHALASINSLKVPVYSYVIGALGSGGGTNLKAIAVRKAIATVRSSISVASPYATLKILYRKGSSDDSIPPLGLWDHVSKAIRLSVKHWRGRVLHYNLLPEEADPRATARRSIIPEMQNDMKHASKMTPAKILRSARKVLHEGGSNVNLIPNEAAFSSLEEHKK